eukprot:6118746-Pyramimonas_sp.AAC.1
MAKLGKRLAYSLGSASASAAFWFTVCRSARHRPTTSDALLGRYVRAMNAASGIRPVSHSSCTQSSVLCRRKSARKATLCFPFCLASSARRAMPSALPVEENMSSSPERSHARVKHDSASTSSPEDIASSPSCVANASRMSVVEFGGVEGNRTLRWLSGFVIRAQ